MPACGTVSAHTRPQARRARRQPLRAKRTQTRCKAGERARQQREARAARDWRARTDNGRRYSATRRARVKAVFIEDVDPTVVFERDGYVCQGCGTDCPRDAKWPRLDAATVDHIVAIANGGEHSYANTQTLCFACNTSKGTRPQIFPSACDAGSQDAITASLEKGERENGW